MSEKDIAEAVGCVNECSSRLNELAARITSDDSYAVPLAVLRRDIADALNTFLVRHFS